MSEYTQALSELASLPRRLSERIASTERDVTAERKRREAEIERVVKDHRSVVAQLEAVLVRARREGVEIRSSAAAAGDRRDGSPTADPVEYARQLVGRLERALADFSHTRRALAVEEERLGREDRERIAEQRLFREREELRREEQWERARQGTVGLLAGLVVATLVGVVAGLVGSAAASLLPVLSGSACAVQAVAVTSTLPALAVTRASGSAPGWPEAPVRETRLAAAGNGASALALCSGAMAAAALLSGAPGPTAVAALVLSAFGALAVVAVWIALPAK